MIIRIAPTKQSNNPIGVPMQNRGSGSAAPETIIPNRMIKPSTPMSRAILNNRIFELCFISESPDFYMDSTPEQSILPEHFSDFVSADAPLLMWALELQVIQLEGGLLLS